MTHPIAPRKLGTEGPRVSALGLGYMGMSDAYAQMRMLDSEKQTVRT